MDFWGVEVVAGKPLEVEFGDHSYLHVSQAALGESKGGKGADERVVLRAQVGEQEIVIGTLVAGKCDQISFDLIFDKGFKLSHNNKAHSVYFCGYTSESPGEEYFSSDEEEGEDEDVEEIEPAEEAKLNGKPGKDKKANAAASTVEAATAAQDAKKVGSKGSAAGIALKAEKKKPNVVEEKSESEEDEDESEEDDDDEDDDEYDEVRY
ncbi:hypothetical protein O6H91_21G075000 [Diphasiastrum complanatum]|uniref:Uncharacterized protein n=1 Tax=Diphasiastrum complanatum TaxID=34168 RepID=A0ACC2ALZ9_DIPCM|nr:hypothetical protein O6H91_21G075000 [Diphasiastrum complanatum]